MALVVEYGYAYQELPIMCTPARAAEHMERNVSNSMLWDRWRAENAPTAEDIARRAKA